MTNRLWVTGYRNYEFGVFNDKDPKLTIIKYSLTKAMTQAAENGTTWIITGGQLGVEQWSVEVASSLKSAYPELRIALITPFLEFGNQWQEANQDRFQHMLSLADYTESVSHQPYQSPTQLRNYQTFMLSHTDGALLYFDTEKPGKPQYDYESIQNYQKNNNYPLTLVDFYQLQDDAGAYNEAHSENDYLN